MVDNRFYTVREVQDIDKGCAKCGKRRLPMKGMAVYIMYGHNGEIIKVLPLCRDCWV